MDDRREVHLLGPTRALRNDEPLTLRGVSARTVLARLALAGGRVVTVDELIDAVWGDDPPDKPTASLQSVVSRLRARLGKQAIVSEGGGYRIDPDLVTVDVDLVETAADRAEAADPDEAAEILSEALTRWRGEPLADVAWTTVFHPERARLEELRWRLVDRRHQSLIDAGRAESTLADLERDASAAPLRESTQLLFMRALDCCGRTAEALRVGARYRELLGEETGLEPSAALVELESAILAAERAPRAASRPVPTAAWTPPDTPLVGRVAELAELGAAIAARRLVTIVGTGGVGKTRLAMELVAAVDDVDVVVVELARVGRGADVARAVAAGLGLESIDAGPASAIAERLSLRPTLVVFDNCEHVLADARDLIDRLLRRVPSLRVLATSRRRLGLPEEQLVRVGPLPVPTEAMADAPVLQLFGDRVRRSSLGVEIAVGDVPIALDVCRILDGVPLAVELAAGRVGLLGLGELRRRLLGGVGVLSAGAGDDERRQATVEGAVAWSIDLLDEPARELFDELSVFSGPFVYDAVASVTSVADPLASLGELVEASLVIADPAGDQVTYRLLEPVRQVSSSRLGDQHARDLAERYAAWVMRLGDRIETQWRGGDRAGAQALVERRRTDLLWCLGHLDDGDAPGVVDKLAVQLAWLLQERPDLELMERIRAQAGESADGLLARAALGWCVGDPEGSIADAERMLDMVDPADARVPLALGAKTPAHMYRGEIVAAISSARACLAHDGLTAELRTSATAAWALAELYNGSAETAAAVLESGAADLARSNFGGFGTYARAEVAALTDNDAARRLCEQAINEAVAERATFQRRVAEVLRLSLLVRADAVADAVAAAGSLVPNLLETGNTPQAWTALRLVAELLEAHGRDEVAASLLAAAAADPRAPALLGPAVADERARWLRIEQRLGEDRAAKVAAHAVGLSLGALWDLTVAALADLE